MFFIKILLQRQRLHKQLLTEYSIKDLLFLDGGRVGDDDGLEIFWNIQDNTDNEAREQVQQQSEKYIDLNDALQALKALAFKVEFLLVVPLSVGAWDGHLSVSNGMTHSQVSLTRDQDCQEDRGAEADVVEGVGELGDEVDPDQAVLRPGPSEH